SISIWNMERVKTIVESPDLSGPVDSGDSVDLQCWVQMENVQCFEEHMVWWFRSGLDQSGPGLVYTQRNSSAQCDRSTEDPGPHKCLYTFSKTMSPSDAGTYRCAVAACGHILFGNGTKIASSSFLIFLISKICIFIHCGEGKIIFLLLSIVYIYSVLHCMSWSLFIPINLTHSTQRTQTCKCDSVSRLDL
uniref:Ig-like domain-containing protein n=1 Tax=Periophthalmus magnuspinnatus TaxID=409849 RepID=A0A3B4ABH9_9GOBI